MDAALVAFYSHDQEDWRFSFVKMEYKFDEKGKPIKELTPAKRYSFLVGKNEPNHTCKKQFIELLIEENISPTLNDLEKAFSVDNVTKEFFEEYKNRFFELKAEIERILNQNKTVSAEFELKGINSIEFAKKLLGQIVFLYFLQKKGWLGIKKSDTGFDEWGAGPKDFMKKLFNKELVNYDNFFNDILEPLFYQALANDRRADNDYYEKLKCKIPFLNGGLFEPIKAYSWETTDVIINDNVFKDIFATFDRFNFTIKEDEPLEKEVAVDPEMLGKVFENLLDVTDRKSKGAFYTPREIVHYMCQQSLINYLETNTKELSLTRGEIELFIQQGDTALNQVKRIIELNKSNQLDLLKEGDEKFILPTPIRKNYEELDKLLLNIKICDPAVGSGAFPVGMMNEIVKARNILTYFYDEKEQKERTDYYLKRQTIENSLYGVDIEPSAVEITKLRFWLSLIVDETDMKNINPLPNLDNKIMCGNSLLEEYKGIKLFDKSLILTGSSLGRQMTLVKKESEYKFELLQQLQNELFNEQDRNKKKNLMKKIEDIEWEFIEQSLKEQKKENEIKEIEKFKSSKAKPFFLWELYFADVFKRENPGFDIVIANPPYGATIDEYTRIFEKIYPNTTKAFKDIYKIFIDKSISELNRDNGILTYIIPNTFLLQPRYKDLRSFLLNYEIKTLLNFGEDVFEAVVPTAVLIIKKVKPAKNLIHFGDLSVKSKFLGDLNFITWSLIPQEKYLQTKNYIFLQTFRELKPNEEFLENILDFKDAGINYQRINVGLGDKGNSNLSERLLYDGNRENKDDEMYWKGTDINEYYISKKTNRFVRVKTIDKLNKNERVILNKNYFALKPKLIWRQTAAYPIVSLDTRGIWFGRSVQAGIIKKEFIKIIDYNYLLALLNSKYLRFTYIQTVKESGRVFPQVKLEKLANLPIKKIPIEEQKQFAGIVDKIFKITMCDDYLDNSDEQVKVKKLEKEIDQLVYKLYGLTSEEIKIVEENGKE
ncbi:MAG: N-6 DNA methylase [Sphaerochaetaceae bacterium]|nr:N-6 DNA methylase [Sphaerochaetaceae bacterium]